MTLTRRRPALNRPAACSRKTVLSRRNFLKLGALLGAGLAWPAAVHAAGAPRVASALPLPGAEHLPADAWPARPPAGLDLLLVPAYVAADYIRGGHLQPLYGPRGRAHDPEGAFTWPYAHHVAALLGRRPGQSASWAAVWQGAPGARWPVDPRLVIGAALLRRGYSPNDTHAGHLAQVEADLLDLAPRLAGGSTPGLAFGWVDLAAVSAEALPQEGTLLVEYDWVIPLGAADPVAARAFAMRQAPAALPSGRPSVPLVPLMPLPPRAAEQHAALWATINRGTRLA
jgi:hypothetical protein